MSDLNLVFIKIDEQGTHRVEFYRTNYRYSLTRPGKVIHTAQTYTDAEISRDEMIQQYLNNGFSDETEGAN